MQSFNVIKGLKKQKTFLLIFRWCQSAICSKDLMGAKPPAFFHG